MDKKILLNQLIQEYRKTHRKSEQIFKRSSLFQVKGGSHNLRLFEPFPFYDLQCLGSKVKDVDGHTYLDFWQGHFANILGHNPQIVRDSLVQSLEKGEGLISGFPGQYQNQLAELILSSIHAEKIRFTTSGTLASMYALMLAKAFTNREIVMKAGGGWHGAQPYVLKGISTYNQGLNQVESAGLHSGIESSIIVSRFNHIEDLEEIFSRYGERIACLIVEPFVGAGGFIISKKEYLQKARELTQKYGSLLILDEVISGFRFHPGGLHNLYKIKPDLSIWGKSIGGGMPVAAVAGREDVMNLCHPQTEKERRVRFEGGTFSAHPASIQAGLVFLRYLIDNGEKIYSKIGKLGNKVRRQIKEIFKTYGFKVFCTGDGGTVTPHSSLVGVHFIKEKAEEITSPEEIWNPQVCDIEMREKIFKLAMLKEGINIFHGYGAISYAHTEDEIQESLDAVEKIAKKWKKANFRYL